MDDKTPQEETVLGKGLFLIFQSVFYVAFILLANYTIYTVFMIYLSIDQNLILITMALSTLILMWMIISMIQLFESEHNKR